MPIEEEQHISLRSNQVNKVLGKPPQWLIRWGSLVLLLIITMLLVLSAMVVYPETISAGAIVTLQDTGIFVLAKQNSTLCQILVKDKQSIKKNDALAIVKEPAGNYDTLHALLDGCLIAQRVFNINDSLIKNEQLFTIMPAIKKTTIHILLQPGQGLKVKPGMVVTIALTGYPADEYGVLKGHLITGAYSEKNTLICQASLTEPWPSLITQALLTQKEIKAVASIIVDNKPVIKSLFVH